jgi:RNA polymerase sigma factor (sigma-70 family)
MPRFLRTDADVIAASLAAPEQFASIFDRHAATIHAYLARRVPREADALLGEVFRVAFERRLVYRLDRPDALPWLYGIAWNIVFKERRSTVRGVAAAGRLGGMRDTTVPATEQSDDRLDGASQRSRLTAALASLPDGERETLLLFAWEELSYEAIAEALAVPVGTVRSRLSRARSRLRELLEQHGEEPVVPTHEGGAFR